MTENMPPNFGFRYIAWAIWSNAITIVSSLTAIFTAITLDPTLVSHTAFHWIVIGVMAGNVILAQIKRNNPPTPPPPVGAKTGG